jgi:hypothetical protein
VRESGKAIWKVLKTIYTKQSILLKYGCGLHMRSIKLISNSFIFCLHVKYPLPPGDKPIAVNKYYYEILRDGLFMWRVWVMRGVYRFLVRKPEGWKPLGRPRRRWVDNIEMDVQEVLCVCME